MAGDARAARDLPCDLVVPCTEDVEDVVRAAALKLVETRLIFMKGNWILSKNPGEN